MSNKIALVFGGTRGIGAASVQKLAESGYDVAFTYVTSAPNLPGRIGGSRTKGYAVDICVSEQVEKDRSRGFTQSGPHRADIRVRIHGLSAADVLSRGQQKLVVAAMKLAQGRLFKATQGGECVFLIDDLPAELDRQHRRQLCRLLAEMRCQVLLSCVDAGELSGCWDELGRDELRLFHVEHGALRTLH